MVPKTPKADTDGKPSTAALNEREGKMISFVLKSLPASIKTSIDFKAFAMEFGQKDSRAAQDSFRYLCKKYGWFEGNGATCATPSTPTNKKAMAKPTPTKRAANNDDGVVDESPTKKKRTTRPKKAASEKEATLRMEDLDPADIDMDLAQGLA